MSSQKQKILVVDDSQELRDLLLAHLQEMGYQVREARDGAEVEGILENEVPDLILLDVMMPQLNGFQICRKIKSEQRWNQVPVLMLTAKTRPEDIFWGKDCGADEYITKPFRTTDLEVRVRRLLSRSPITPKSKGNPFRWIKVEEVLQKRPRAAGERVLCSLSWDAKAVEIFRKKYGEVQFGEVMDRIHEVVKVILAGESLSAGAEFQAKKGLRLLLEGSREQAENLAKKLAFHLNHLLRSFYSREDLDRGGVLYRKYRGKKQIQVPILEFEARLSFIGES